jgi:hypothetical protein
MREGFGTGRRTNERAARRHDQSQVVFGNKCAHKQRRSGLRKRRVEIIKKKKESNPASTPLVYHKSPGAREHICTTAADSPRQRDKKKRSQQLFCFLFHSGGTEDENIHFWGANLDARCFALLKRSIILSVIVVCPMPRSASPPGDSPCSSFLLFFFAIASVPFVL